MGSFLVTPKESRMRVLTWFYILFSMNSHLPWLELGSFTLAAWGTFIDVRKTSEFWIQRPKGSNEDRAQSGANAMPWGYLVGSWQSWPSLTSLLPDHQPRTFSVILFSVNICLKNLVKHTFQGLYCGPTQGDAERSGRELSPKASDLEGTEASGWPS